MEETNQNKQNNNNTDLRELLDFFVGQFDKVYREFDKIHLEFDKIHQNKTDKTDIDRVLTRIAMLGTKIDDYRAEQFAMQRQLDKHEKWHFETAGKVGLELSSK